VEDLYILIGSAIAVAMMVAVAAWARIARPAPPLDEASARAMLADEFPDDAPGQLWIAADGCGVIGRDGDRALVLFRLGDSWVARSLAWDDAIKAPVRGGKVRLRLRDPAAPIAALAVSGVNPWPPQDDNEAIAA
jgi:hypothetical protein